MILSGFQEEHQLLDWYEQDSISALQYIEHHSIGMINRFKKWCQESGSSEDEESAKDFLDEYNGLFLDTVVSKNENSTAADTSMFHQWCENSEFLDELYSSKPALHVTLWRYQNPCSTDKQKCAHDLDVSTGDIEKLSASKVGRRIHINGDFVCLPTTYIDKLLNYYPIVSTIVSFVRTA